MEKYDKRRDVTNNSNAVNQCQYQLCYQSNVPLWQVMSAGVDNGGGDVEHREIPALGGARSWDWHHVLKLP